MKTNKVLRIYLFFEIVAIAIIFVIAWVIGSQVGKLIELI